MSITRAPWTALDGPTQGHRAQGVRDPDSYRQAHAAFLRANTDREIWPAGQTQASVNHGRWIVDCPCGNGPLASRAWQLACCFECGAVFDPVTFPAEAEAIEQALLMRPARANQNWIAGESLAQLASDNAAHGLEG